MKCIIAFSLDPGLLMKLDEVVQALGQSRSSMLEKFIVSGLESRVAMAESDDPKEKDTVRLHDESQTLETCVKSSEQ